MEVTLRDGFRLGYVTVEATFVPEYGDPPPPVRQELPWWGLGVSHTLRSAAGEVPADPERVVVELAFPDTTYRHRVECRPR